MSSDRINFEKLQLIPIVTFLLGGGSFCLLSMYYRVFWINTKYDIPLVYNISVMVGDSIFLPLINYQIGKLLFRDIKICQQETMQRTIVIWTTISLLLSGIINVFAHLAWKNDIYSDFISVNGSTFLLSGWWHLFFSILEMTIIFLFPLLWYTSIKQNNLTGITRSIRIWSLIFIFSTLAIFDMLMKYFFVYKLTFLSTIKTDYFAFVTPTISILLLIIMVSIKNQSLKDG